ncbi:MAG: glycosyltransferase family 2 protein [Acidobacteriaceae bacterium]|nr:glycosyltransferase family 2 protein [Acidobacteriaceae bacterium]
MFAKLVLWAGLGIPFYAYIGYPIVLVLLRRLIHRPVKKARYTPFISILIPAYNEEEMIGAKIRNCLSLDYPAEQMEIVVACDGPTDGTTSIAKSFEDGGRVRVLDYKVNRGKTTILNEGVKELKGEVVVFSDAAALLYSDSVRRILENFADPEVGAVSGKYVVVKADEVDVGKSEDVYWRYETFLKVQESELASSLGAHGHLHAIRKSLYPVLPPGTINDDYIIPVSVLGKGYRAVYEPKAIVYEEAREMTGFGRRVRIMAGNLQQLREIKSVLRPLLPLPLFFFLSHKVSRLLVPFGMLAALIANLFLLNEPLYQLLFIAQAVFYVVALLGTVFKLRPKAIMLPFYFCMINAATFFGLYHALTSRRKMAWK